MFGHLHLTPIKQTFVLFFFFGVFKYFVFVFGYGCYLSPNIFFKCLFLNKGEVFGFSTVNHHKECHVWL